ncbi:MAG: ABC transporter ATP-binding protein [Phycisphaeraceae bacterium]|nr:MAG: ABC transporter ATP-binding protein [Phycisphaeraceae bacterium]
MLLRCEGVCKSYPTGSGRVEALRGLSLEIEEPGFHAIMGQSGSGKSTLLHLLAALDRPDAGTIEVAGRAVHSMSEREATAYRRRGIGLVFQQFNLIPTLTAMENVELPGVLAGEPAVEARRRAGELLERLGVSGRAGHRPDAMSGGEQQRVAIARALLFRPPLVLADEPTGSLDSASSERLWSLLREVSVEHRVGVLMVTHEPAAASHCLSAFVVKDGRLHGRIVTEGLDAGGVATRYQQCVRAS